MFYFVIAVCKTNWNCTLYTSHSSVVCHFLYVHSSVFQRAALYTYLVIRHCVRFRNGRNPVIWRKIHGGSDAILRLSHGEFYTIRCIYVVYRMSALLFSVTRTETQQPRCGTLVSIPHKLYRGYFSVPQKIASTSHPSINCNGYRQQSTLQYLRKQLLEIK